jgi:glyoxylase-like metal-dependent hydrolase (beta-lactamase superfamily II)
MHMTSARLRFLATGAFRLDGGGMFGLIPKTMWSKWTECDGDNRIALATRSLLVETRDGLVLVEAGCGDKWSEKERATYALEPRTAVDALGEIGVDPRDIAHVVLTHLHFDHAAGLTRADGAGAMPLVPVFPNARIHVQRQEWLDALANKSTMTRTYLRSHLDPIAGAVELHDGATTPLDRIALIPTPGHTWGHQSVLVLPPADVSGARASPAVLFAGDACPTIHHAHPAASLGYDMLAYESMLSKREILGRALREGWLVALDHDPRHALVRPIEADGRVMLEPVGSDEAPA